MSRFRILLIFLAAAVLIASIYYSTRTCPIHTPVARYVPAGMEEGGAPYGWASLCFPGGWCDRCGIRNYINYQTPGMSTMVLVSYCSVPDELKGLSSDDELLGTVFLGYVDSSYINGTMTVDGGTAYYSKHSSNGSAVMTVQGLNGNIFYQILCSWNTSGNEESKVMSLIESLDF